MCYGYFEFVPQHSSGIPSPRSMPWDCLLHSDEIIDALLLEYLPGPQLSVYNVSLEIASDVLKAVEKLQSAGIIHGDITSRHIILKDAKTESPYRVAFVSFFILYHIHQISYEKRRLTLICP